MGGIFSYDSKLMQMLDTLGNTIMLTFLFVLCCLPVITIGVSFTALFAACRAQTRGKACFRAFFAAFKSNFLKATGLWLLLGALIYLCIGAALSLYRMDGSLAVFIMSVVAGCLLLILLTMALLFYSRFECSFPQLIKNGMVMVLCFPIRSLLITVLAWLPVLCFFGLPNYFVALGILWVLLYFGTAGAVCVWFMKKPFARLAEKLLGVVESDVIDEPAHD